MHGLFRSRDLELGRDEDSGGQITYVLELAKKLGELDGIDKIDIITRYISDSEYPGYSQKIEPVSQKVDIVRIKAGPDKYLKKFELWPYINDFTENVKTFIKESGRRPDVLHSNFADSGLVCSMLSEELKIPQVHTSHSLARPEMEKTGTSEKEIEYLNKTLHFEERMKAEQRIINNAKIIVASTNQEIETQYSGYETKGLENKFRVVSPGINPDVFYPPSNINPSPKEGETFQLLENLISQNFKHPEKTLVTTLSRVDRVKNLNNLIRAFAIDKSLSSVANLAIFGGNLKSIGKGQPILDEMNNLIRASNLYGSVFLYGDFLDYFTQVPAYYRFFSKKRGIFVNPAFIEPFGLTVIEAGACGLPVVATKNGGPSEIINDGENGLLVDPESPADIAKKIRAVIETPGLWDKLSENGKNNIKKNYTWTMAAKKYFEVFVDALK